MYVMTISLLPDFDTVVDEDNETMQDGETWIRCSVQSTETICDSLSEQVGIIMGMLSDSLYASHSLRSFGIDGKELLPKPMEEEKLQKLKKHVFATDETRLPSSSTHASSSTAGSSVSLRIPHSQASTVPTSIDTLGGTSLKYRLNVLAVSQTFDLLDFERALEDLLEKSTADELIETIRNVLSPKARTCFIDRFHEVDTFFACLSIIILIHSTDASA